MNNFTSANKDRGGYWSDRKKGRGGGGRRRSAYGRFPKFADNDYRNNDGNYYNDKKYLTQNDWQKNNDRHQNNERHQNNDRYQNNDDAGIVPWQRRAPIKPLIIPPQSSNDRREDNQAHNAQNAASENTDNSAVSDRRLSNSVNSMVKTEKNSVSTNNYIITGYKQDIIKPKEEPKSSSSSSSSESSSSEEMPEPQKTFVIKTPLIKTEAKESHSTKAPTSSLNNKLKPKANQVNETSTSSSSSEEEQEPPTPQPPPTPNNSAKKATETKLQKQETKTKSPKGKLCLEDDVVYMGNLENKFVLEDDSDQEEENKSQDEEEIRTNKKSKKSSKKAEECKICDKKGHTSFQCQMICKNCSEPYHGYRTCPHPTNLNTMMQLFLEFCMQQFQQFTATKDLDNNSSSGVSNPQVDSPLAHAVNKINTLKRKQSKTFDTKSKSAKKRKISGGTKKKREKGNNVDDEDNDSTNSSFSENGEDTAESDNSTSSESLVSSKKKIKLKNKHSTKIPYIVPNFTPNSLNIPLVLNSFKNLTAGATAETNPNISNNALSTLLLTQMFQNAIGSIK